MFANENGKICKLADIVQLSEGQRSHMIQLSTENATATDLQFSFLLILLYCFLVFLDRLSRLARLFPATIVS